MDGSSLTYLDAALFAVCLISGLLAMYRGLARELLSILSWIAAAGAGYWFFNSQKGLSADLAAQTGLPAQIAAIAAALVVALIVLIVVHLITARISDAILDSNVGMVDRVLGFLFGVARGFVLFVIPFMAYEAFVTADKQAQHPIIRDAMSRDYLKSASELIRSIILTYMPQSPTGAPAASPSDQQGFLNEQRRFVTLVREGQRYYISVEELRKTA